MCAALLPPGVNPTAVNRYIYMYMNNSMCWCVHVEGGGQEGIILLLRCLNASIEENHKESWNFLYPDCHSNRIPLKHINHKRYCYKHLHDRRI